MTELKKLSIIIVSYNDRQYLINCIKSIYEKFDNYSNWEIIIVNNDPNQNISEFSLDFSKIKLLDYKKNVGFGAGINLGAKLAEGEFLLVLNSDTKIIASNIFDVLSEFSKDDRIGIIGGGILDEKNNNQEWSAGKELSLYDLARNNLGVSRSESIWNSSEKVECDWVAGTAMFVKKDLFEKLGGFDERFFMYFEDMDLCRRVRKLGKKVLFFTEFKIFHGSGECYEDKRLQKKHYYDSMEKYFQKNRGFFSWMIVKIFRKILIRK